MPRRGDRNKNATIGKKIPRRTFRPDSSVDADPKVFQRAAGQDDVLDLSFRAGLAAAVVTFIVPYVDPAVHRDRMSDA